MCLYMPTHVYAYLYVWMYTAPRMNKQTPLKPWFSFISPFHMAITSPRAAFHLPLLYSSLTWVIISAFTPGPLPPTLTLPASPPPSSPLDPACAVSCTTFLSSCHKSLAFVSLLIPEHFFLVDRASCEDDSHLPSQLLGLQLASKAGIKDSKLGWRHPNALSHPLGTSWAHPLGLVPAGPGTSPHPCPEQCLAWLAPCSFFP